MVYFGSCEIIYEWKIMKYDWEGIGEDEELWKQEGLYIEENCILAGIKQWKDTIYVTIPRWAPGVPATLNRIVEVNGEPLLLPFPDIADQMINKTDGIKYVQGDFSSLNNSIKKMVLDLIIPIFFSIFKTFFLFLFIF